MFGPRPKPISIPERPRVRVGYAAPGTPRGDTAGSNGLFFANGTAVGGRSHGGAPADHHIIHGDGRPEPAQHQIFVATKANISGSLPATRSPARRTQLPRCESPTFCGSTKLDPPHGRKHVGQDGTPVRDSPRRSGSPLTGGDRDLPTTGRRSIRPADNLEPGQEFPKPHPGDHPKSGPRAFPGGGAPAFEPPAFVKAPYVCHRRHVDRPRDSDVFASADSRADSPMRRTDSPARTSDLASGSSRPTTGIRSSRPAPRSYDIITGALL